MARSEERCSEIQLDGDIPLRTECKIVDCICFSLESHGQASTRVHCALNHTVYCQNLRIRDGENEQKIQTSPYVTRNGWTGAASWSEVAAGLEGVLSRVKLRRQVAAHHYS
jgi:hypothetical protein